MSVYQFYFDNIRLGLGKSKLPFCNLGSCCSFFNGLWLKFLILFRKDKEFVMNLMSFLLRGRLGLEFLC